MSKKDVDSTNNISQIHINLTVLYNAMQFIRDSGTPMTLDAIKEAYCAFKKLIEE